MKNFDIVIVVFNVLNYDARALNLANSLISLNYKVLVISIKSDIKDNYTFQNIEIEVDNTKRMFSKWIDFVFKAYRIIKTLNFKAYIASDLYSLPNIFNLKNIEITYDSREIYSALASLKNRKLSQKVITIIEKVFLKKVNKVIVSGELDRDYLIKRKEFQKDFYVIKNLPPNVKIKNSNYLRDKYAISNQHKIAIYQGAILNNRGLFPFIEAIADIDDIFFVLVGENSLGNKLSKFINYLDLSDRCKIHPQVNYRDLLSITQSADFGISLFEPVSDSYQYALPNKIFEYLSSGIPYLATNLPAINLLTKETEAGILVNNVYNDVELKEKLLELIKKYDKLKKNAEHKMKNYTYDSQINEIKRLVQYV